MEKHYLKHKHRLRQRYIDESLSGFHDYEVLELLLSYSLSRQDTKPIAKKLIEHFGSISQVMNASVEELCRIEGVSERTAVLLKIIKDSSAYMIKDKILKTYFVRSSEDVINYLKHQYKGQKTESFIVFYLNSKNMIIKVEELFKGTVNEAKIYFRTLITHILNYNASAIIVSHNHPSGNPEISPDDIKSTRKLKELLVSIDVILLDHIVCGGIDYISMNDQKLM